MEHSPKPGEAAAAGPSAIIVEKHKSNFMALHGTFSDKPSENIARWIEKADTYRKNHMIKWRNLSQTGKIGSGKNTKYFFSYWA